MFRSIKKFSYSVLSLAVAAGAVFMIHGHFAVAVEHTVASGESIQAAINAAADGDTIVVAAGTYEESLNIRKPLTLRGNGEVVVNTQTNDANKGVDIQNTADVTIENFVFDGSNSVGQTGVDINSAQNVVLSNVLVRNYGKNGISVTTQYGDDYLAGGDVTFNNVSVDNAAWAGIAFYERNSISPANVGGPMSGVVFSGTTTVTDTQWGIQLGDRTNSGLVTGLSGAALDLGHVVFTGNTNNISNDQSDAIVTISETSTIDGEFIEVADFGSLNVEILAVAEEQPVEEEAENETGLEAPNTGFARE